MAARARGLGVVVAGAVVGFSDAALCAILAIVVLAVDAGKRANRMLALLLVGEGAAQLSAGFYVLPGVAPDVRAGFLGVFSVALAVVPPIYLLVVAELDTPVGRPLRHPIAASALLGCGALLATVYLASEGISVDSRLPLTVLAVAMLAAFAIGAWAWTRAPQGSARRRQATAFMLAFGVRDIVFLAYLIPAALVWTPPWPLAPFDVALPFLGTLFFVPLLAYGILQAQLFDIDLRLKRGLKAGVVGAAFVAAFFVASEGAQMFLTPRLGPVVGLVACGMLVFAFSPLQRLADHLAGAAMPGVSASTEYLAFRKLEVYKAAIESAHESGGISDKERDSLSRLRGKLGIRTEDAASIERDVIGSAASST